MNATASLKWARGEFGEARLGNALRNRRAVQLAASTLRKPAGTVTGVVKSAAEREGAFRFLNNPHVSPAVLARSSHLATARRCSAPYTFVVVDQTAVSITDWSGTKGLGPAGDGRSNKKRGAEVMSAMAVASNGTPLGLLAQQWWRRSDEASPTYNQDTRPAEERESDLWLRALEDVHERLQQVGSPTRPWFQLDRGGDFWRVFEYAEQHDAWLTVRSAYDRCLWDREVPLHRYITRTPIRGQLNALIPARREPNKATRRARTASLSIRYEVVPLELTDNDRDKVVVEVTALHVVERSTRRDRIEWVLLTTYPVNSLADAKLVVRGYTRRWRIEEFHRAWKSGACDIQSSQLRSPDAFCRWATILAAVASRIEQLKHFSRTTPNVAATVYLTRTEIDAAIVLSETRKFAPGDELTIAQAVELVARAGGYTGKSSGGPPGTITISRGLRDVQAAAAVIDRLRKPDEC
jgi:hypothetical protein